MKVGRIVLFILAVGFLVLEWRWYFPPAPIQETLRYRMTLTVEAEGQPVEGSTVIEVSLGRAVGMAYAMGKRGEAAVVDLGPRGLLFAILLGANVGQSYWEMLPERILAPALGADAHVTQYDDDRLGVFKRLLARPRGEKVALPFDKLPMLVRFRDIDDPKTVERVDPENLAPSFGPGVSLKRVTVEITNDAVTRSVEQTLPWLATVGRERGTLIPNPPRLLKDFTPEQRITPGDFTSFDIWSK